jgi:hypothetical protein
MHASSISRLLKSMKWSKKPVGTFFRPPVRPPLCPHAHPLRPAPISGPTPAHLQLIPRLPPSVWSPIADPIQLCAHRRRQPYLHSSPLDPLPTPLAAPLLSLALNAVPPSRALPASAAAAPCALARRPTHASYAAVATAVRSHRLVDAAPTSILAPTYGRRILLQWTPPSIRRHGCRLFLPIPQP